MTNTPAAKPVHRIHVEGRTPGSFGKAPMVTLTDAVPEATEYVGSHHEAVYLKAVLELAAAEQQGHTHLVITSPSEHLVEQMNGNWQIGEELRPFHDLAKLLSSRFASVQSSRAPRSP